MSRSPEWYHTFAEVMTSVDIRETNMRPFLLLMLLVANTRAFAVELKLHSVIGTPVEGRKEGWQGHVDFIAWLDDETIVYAGKSGFIKYHSLDQQAEKWSTRVEGNLCQLVKGRDHLFVLDDDGTVHVLEKAGGKMLKRLDKGTFETITGLPLFRPVNIAWVPKHNAMLISEFSEEYGEHLFLIDDQTFEVVGRAKSEGFLTQIHPTHTGSHIVSLSHKNNIRIWSIDEKREVFLMGENMFAGIDASFTSNAFSDGNKTLVYSVDDSWSTGDVHIFDTNQKIELVQFDSRNGHLEMDVDFMSSRIALTGTKQNLTIVDFKGRVLAELENVADQRVASVKFSPRRNRIAIGSWDNTLRVFEFKTKDAVR